MTTPPTPHPETLAERLRRLGSDFCCHPVSRGIDDCEEAGAAMLDAAHALADPSAAQVEALLDDWCEASGTFFSPLRGTQVTNMVRREDLLMLIHAAAALRPQAAPDDDSDLLTIAYLSGVEKGKSMAQASPTSKAGEQP